MTNRVWTLRLALGQLKVTLNIRLHNEMSLNINSYKLPVVDVDTQMRNFPGYQSQVLTDWTEVSEEGTTDTGPGAEKRNDSR